VPRFEFTRILVPIDFTRESEKPLRYASLLAEAHGGKIVLLHVTKPIKFCVDVGYGPVNREVPDEPQTRRDRSRLRRFSVHHLRENLLTEILIRSGEAAEEIVNAARAQKADLIVLCAHEETGKESIRSHETAEHVARFAPCPVLIVRKHEQDFAPPAKAKQRRRV
jgi:nucleotide-binding universal stress UspA family protein